MSNFCLDCGRELQDGEVCNCRNSANQGQMNWTNPYGGANQQSYYQGGGQNAGNAAYGGYNNSQQPSYGTDYNAGQGQSYGTDYNAGQGQSYGNYNTGAGQSSYGYDYNTGAYQPNSAGSNAGQGQPYPPVDNTGAGQPYPPADNTGAGQTYGYDANGGQQPYDTNTYFGGQAGPDAGQPYPNSKEPKGNPFSNVSMDMGDIAAFISNLKNRIGIGTPESNSVGTFERNMKIVPDCIDSTENEIPIKQYNIAVLRTRLQFKRAEGRLQVTNKRIIFRASGHSLVGRTLQQQEFALDNLKGIEIRKDHRLSFLNFFGLSMLNSVFMYLAVALANSMLMRDFNTGLAGLLGLLLGLGGIASFFLFPKKFIIKASILSFTTGFLSICNIVFQYRGNNAARFMITFLMILTCILLFICFILICFVPNLVLVIKTEGKTEGNGGSTGGAVLLRRKPTFWECFFGHANASDEYTGFAEVMPWIDTDIAVEELGSMIDDLQKLGDNGVEKWRVI